MEPSLIFVVLLSILSPILGSAIGIIKMPSNQVMYNMLSFAAAIMLAIAFLELIPEAIEIGSLFLAILGLIIGTTTMYLFDKLIPHIHPATLEQEQGKHLKRTAIFIFWGIFLHNFPEGIAIAASSISNIKLSMTVAIGLAMHNIPEGIMTSAPYYKATGNRLKAFLISSSTAIPIAIGFVISYFLFKNISANFLSMIIAATAGIMIYISVDELIPASCFKLTNHSTIFSFIVGILLVLLLGFL
jgi:zinc transporter, ZIP family